jgi:hypothetical protein
VATACSLKISGGENYFENCTIGLDTISRSVATYEMLFAAGAVRNHFKDCTFITYAGAAAFTFITTSGALDRFQLFENCTFINAVASGATTMNQAFGIGHTGGMIMLRKCAFVGTTYTETTAGGSVYHDAVTGVSAVTTRI